MNASIRYRKKIPKPPKELGKPGRTLWKAIEDEYAISDAGGLALLLAACRAEDDISRMRETVAREGDVLKSDPSKPHPLLAAIRGSEGVRRQAIRALNLDVEPLKGIGPGRPTGR